jgi:hypothetical protein
MSKTISQVSKSECKNWRNHPFKKQTFLKLEGKNIMEFCFHYFKRLRGFFF